MITHASNFLGHQQQQHRQQRSNSTTTTTPLSSSSSDYSATEDDENEGEDFEFTSEETETDLEDDLEDDDDEIIEDEEDEDNVGMGVSTGGSDWGESVLAAVEALLAEDDTMALYSYKVFTNSKRIDVRIDKLTNEFGSPSLDEVGGFSRKLNAALEVSLGEAVAGEIEIEVSSPGAERLVQVPSELTRFSELPMKVEYFNTTDTTTNKSVETTTTDTTTTTTVGVLRFQGVSEDEQLTRWTLADVRANRSGKGRLLNKKQRETVIEIATGDIKHVNLHVDI